MLAAVCHFGVLTGTHLRLLLHLNIMLGGLVALRWAKVGRWSKVLTLIEMGEVWCSLVNRLGAFL